MSKVVEIPAELREVHGKGASRRLRNEGLVPAILYGGDRDPVSLQIPHRFLIRQLEEESFFTSIMSIKAGKKSQRVILRDLQRHPYKLQIVHVDFQRISDDEELRMQVPLHFINEKSSPAGKKSGVVINHHFNDVEISCLPKHLPEFIEVDLADLDAGDLVHMSDIKLPEGVSLTVHEDDEDVTLVSAGHVHTPTLDEEEADAAAAAAAPEAPPAPGVVGEEDDDTDQDS